VLRSTVADPATGPRHPPGPALELAELAAYLGLDKSTMTGLVDRAEKPRLVERAPNPTDGRAVDVFLTAAAFALAERVRAQVARSLSSGTRTLGRTDRRRLTTLLRRLL
jgi:DNA-binding MarR family transcriptional regulator